MSDKIIQLNEDLIKHDLKDLVRSSVEETLNALILLKHSDYVVEQDEKYKYFYMTNIVPTKESNRKKDKN